MTTTSSKAFASWRKRMNLSYSQAAKALGLCSSVVGFYSRGSRKKDDVDKEVDVPVVVLLACSAVENKLTPIE